MLKTFSKRSLAYLCVLLNYPFPCFVSLFLITKGVPSCFEVPFIPLQNLSKTEAASNESKKLHKSGSLSQVCSEVASGARSKVESFCFSLIVFCNGTPLETFKREPH